MIMRRLLPITIQHRLKEQRNRIRHQLRRWQGLSELQITTRGWERYAKNWARETLPQVQYTGQVKYLGDEWSIEKTTGVEEHHYGLSSEEVNNFEHYIDEKLLKPYLPPVATEALEIGPGGGRFTSLLLPRTEALHVAEPSKTMLRLLRQRFGATANLIEHHTDGTTLPSLRPGSLDYVFAFDVFVHFEPRLVYWYLRELERLLKPQGVGIIHYSNVLTPVGWGRFERELKENLQQKSELNAFGVMCPQLMLRFLEALKLEVISADVGLIPRDAVAVFRKPVRE